MPYSHNVLTALQFKQQLEDMVSGEGHIEITWSTDNPQRLARRLREAMHSAAACADEYPDLLERYRHLLQWYKLSLVDGGVTAKPRSPYISNTVKRALKMSYEEVFTAHQLVTATIKDKAVDEFLCRNFLRDDEKEMEDIRKFAEGAMFEVIDHGESMGITLVRKRKHE